jgi:polar amino acid transport system substrate-binding protein
MCGSPIRTLTGDRWSDLAGKRVGVELGSSGDGFARKWQRRMKFDLAEFDSPDDALRALQRGQVDGVLTDGIAFEDFRRAAGGIKRIGHPLTDEFFVIAVRKDAGVLLEHINAAIDALKSNGRMEELQAEWF